MTHILVVDDETNLVELVRGYLEREGFSVASARDDHQRSRPSARNAPTWWCST